MNGRGGLPQDDREAVRLFKLAADQTRRRPGPCRGEGRSCELDEISKTTIGKRMGLLFTVTVQSTMFLN